MWRGISLIFFVLLAIGSFAFWKFYLSQEEPQPVPKSAALPPEPGFSVTAPETSGVSDEVTGQNPESTVKTPQVAFLELQISTVQSMLKRECEQNGPADYICTLWSKIRGKKFFEVRHILQSECLTLFRGFMPCSMAGRLLSPDEQKKYATFCDTDDPRYCAIAAGSFLATNPGGRETALLLLKGCQRGFLDACLHVGPTVNPEERRQQEERCAAGSAKDCLIIGGALEKTLNLSSAAKTYYDKACASDAGKGCLEWGSNADEKEIAAFKGDCKKTNPGACIRVAAYYRYRVKDFRSAKKFLRLACNAKNSFACEWLQRDEIGFSKIP